MAAIGHQTTDDDAQRDVLRVTPSLLDLGDVHIGEVANGIVRLKNTSQEPIIVTARSSCGCTVADLPDEPIPPGTTVEAAVRFKPRRVSSTPVHKSIRFMVEGLEETVQSVTLQAQAKEFITVTPGNVLMEPGSRIPIEISSADEMRFNVLDVQPPIFDVATVVPLESHVFLLHETLWRDHGAPRRIRFTLDHPKAKKVTLYVREQAQQEAADASVSSTTSSGAGRLQLRPPRMNTGQLSFGNSFVQAVLISDTGDELIAQPTVRVASDDLQASVLDVSRTSNGTLMRVALTPQRKTTHRIDTELIVRVGDRIGSIDVVGLVAGESLSKTSSRSHQRSHSPHLPAGG